MRKTRTVFAVFLFTALVATIGCSSAPPEPEEVPEKKVEAPPPEPELLTGKHYVLIDTTRGEIKLELDADAAPLAVENFLGYVNRKFYDHTIFHRVMKRYYILAGGYDMRLKRKSTRNPIESESDNGLKNLKGAVAMYRGEDPHGATAQFMINLRNNRHFDREYSKGDGFGYTVFGKVVEGMDVVSGIGTVKTVQRSSAKNVPDVPIFIKKMQVVENEEAGGES
jgi:cyclophilin family peptidyl-prolyl cis-trans isomerase